MIYPRVLYIFKSEFINNKRDDIHVVGFRLFTPSGGFFLIHRIIFTGPFRCMMCLSTCLSTENYRAVLSILPIIDVPA